MRSTPWHPRWPVAGAYALLAGLSWLRTVQSFTNEFNYAKCLDHLNCASCVLSWMSDSGCTSGWACFAFANGTGAFTFKACTPTGMSTDECNTGVAPYPAVFCYNGQYQWCACRSESTGDCPSMVNCNCSWTTPTGTGNLSITKACY